MGTAQGEADGLVELREHLSMYGTVVGGAGNQTGVGRPRRLSYGHLAYPGPEALRLMD